jgi:hypothetical protein
MLAASEKTAALSALAALLLFLPSVASAEISDPQPLDGPSADLVEIGDAAMAEDGTGGVVYLKEEGDRERVFVARFRDGAWSAAQRVDVGQAFDSSWPRIAAGNRGRLLVTWVQEFGVGTDRMFSATLDPGANAFQSPIPVDLNVGEATATYPDLTVNAGGQAYLTYVVVTDTSAANPPGYVGAGIRLARYNNRLWSLFGSSVNRNPAAPVRQPTDATGPRIGIDAQGNAVVAWLEPDDEFVDRIWARRAFSGGNVGIPLQVSPSTWEGAPLRGPADAFGLDVSGFGQGAVAFRQQPGQSSKLTSPRIFVNEMPDAFAAKAGAFEGARLIDGGALASPGAPSIGVDPNGVFATAVGAGGATLLAGGALDRVGAVERLDAGASAVAPEPLVDTAESGATVVAWRELQGATGQVEVQERRSDSVLEPATLSAPRGGAVTALRLGGSGLGDAIVAWTQGSGASAQLVASVVDAPPDSFFVQVPEGWRRQPSVGIHWAAATNAIGRVTYSVSVDDEPIGKPTTRLFAPLRSGEIGNGRHRIQIFAIDDQGQETGSRTGLLRIDRKPPAVSLLRRGRRLAVRISDGGRRGASGVKSSTVRVSFGDGQGGTRGKDRAQVLQRQRGKQSPIVETRRHTFPGPGAYRVVVKARDRAGNAVSLERKVKVR